MRRRTQRRRRQRGGGRLWWGLLGAIAALQGTAATKTPEFRTLVSNWWNEGGVANSKALADFITEGNYLPAVEWSNPFASTPVPPRAIEPPSPKQKEGVEEIVDDYLVPIVSDKTKIRVGETYEFTNRSDGSSQRVYILESIQPGQWESDPPMSPNDWDSYSVRGPLPEEQDGGKRRRKTLRRRK